MSFSKLRASVALLSVSAATLVNASSHMIMGGLKPIAYERVDSIVDPGVVASHVHAIMGASSFNPSSTNVTLRESRCTSVPFQTVDKSAYWAPPVYYQDQNTHELTLMPSSFNIYYFFDRNGPTEVTQAFPEGLKMVAGNPYRGTYNASNFADQAVSFVCLDYSGAISNDPAYAERQDINFPDPNKCVDGIRYQVFFPMCWDGVNLDSADHKSHMAYPVDNYNSGTCPSSHPKHLVGLFFEQLVQTGNFDYWGEGAYVLSSGDPTGLAFHGDFQNGWDVSMLQNAVENCHNMNGDINACQVLAPYIDQTAAGACTLDAEVVNENTQGPLAALPGCNPIGVPTGSAPSCPAPAAVPGFVAPVEPLLSGWTDVGCISEATNARALTAASTTSPNMTLNYCANYCGSKNYIYAGVEFGDECYCGNSFSNGATGATVTWDQCNTPCAANPTYEMCGGPQRLELLKFAPGSTPASSSKGVTATSSVAPVVPASPVVSSTASVVSISKASASSSIVTISAPVPTATVSASFSIVSSAAVVSASPSVSSSAAGSKITSSAIFIAKPSSSVSVSSAHSVTTVVVTSHVAAPSACAASSTPSTAASTGNWVSAGCAVDGPARALTGYSFSDDNMTTAQCVSTCGAKGFTLAGTEWTTECYCGNSFSNGLGQQQSSDHCYMSCGGDSTAQCGGTWSLNLYQLQANTKRSKHFGRQRHYLNRNF